MVIDNLLIIDDDEEMIGLIVKAASKELSAHFDHALDGESGLEKALSGKYRIAIIDVNLPKMNGLEVCRKLRTENANIAILMLTSRSDEIDKVLGLEFGADDYVTKPFSPREFVARLKAMLRRMNASVSTSNNVELPETLTFGTLSIDLKKRKVYYNNTRIDLTAVEFDIVYFLASNPGKVFTREQLMSEVMGYESAGYESVITTHLSRIRAKLEPDPLHPKFIQTLRGVGYRFAEADEVS